MKWKLLHIPSVYLLTYLLICPQNALVFHLKPIPDSWFVFMYVICKYVVRLHKRRSVDFFFKESQHKLHSKSV